MYGYRWSPQNRPKAFMWNGAPSDLVLQGAFEIPAVAGYTLSANGLQWNQIPDITANPQKVSVQYNMFAYITDTSHPWLHPIALLAGIYGNRLPSSSCGGGVAYDYSGGVWYAGATISPPSCSQSYGTTVYTGAYSTDIPFSGTKFYRIHFTRQNLVNIINAISAYSCSGGGCPARGYSTNPDNYELEYYGVILETTLSHTNGNSTSFTDRQVAVAAHAYGVTAYAYH